MDKILSKKRLSFGLFVILDLLSIGMGMGVPFFTILLGFPAGWLLPQYFGLPAEISKDSLKTLLKAAGITSAVSMLVLGLIWLPSLSWLFEPGRDLAQFGMPLILFEPLASFIGWIALIVLVSPFLQFLMTVLGSVLRLIKRE
ncbi:MAG: hypothetical protein MUP11_06065 [Anaerolineales bacterium]|nr:hypothetical protein [Anaerolineales bacterium]